MHCLVLINPHMILILQERRVALAEGQPVPQDLLGVLLTAADEAGQKMTDEELWEDVHDVMGAGTCAGNKAAREQKHELC